MHAANTGSGAEIQSTGKGGAFSVYRFELRLPFLNWTLTAIHSSELANFTDFETPTKLPIANS